MKIYENNITKFFSDKLIWNNKNFGLAKPEKKLWVLCDTISLFISTEDFEKSDLDINEEIIEHPNLYVSNYECFKLNNKTYYFNDGHELFDLKQIKELLDDGKYVVIFPCSKVNLFKIVVFDDKIEFIEDYDDGGEHKKSEVILKLVDSLDTKKNEVSERIRKLTLAVYGANKAINFPIGTRLEEHPVSNTIEVEKYFEENGYSFKEPEFEEQIFESLKNGITSFYNNDPYPILKELENFDINIFEKESVIDFHRFDPNYISNLKNEINKIKNDPLFKRKSDIYDKWKKWLNPNSNFNQYKHANFLELSDGLMLYYCEEHKFKFSLRLFIITANLIIDDLKANFNPIDFAEKYYRAIVSKYSIWVNRKNNMVSDCRYIKDSFAEEFKNQYLLTIKESSKIKLIDK